MKTISKGSEPQELIDWKKAHPTAEFKNLREAKRFPGADRAKYALRAALKREQGGLCCYCESRLNGENFHIEHFKPKGKALFPELQLAYSNLHASCMAEKENGKELQCGHKKDDQFSADLISPLQSDCADHFEYEMSGEVIGVDAPGNETIKILNLNSQLLQKSRKNLIDYFESLEDEYQEEVKNHLEDSAYPLGEFYTMIQYLDSRGMLNG